MRLTKYEHSCIVLEEDGQKLVIDPGVLTASFTVDDSIVAVVVTHVHPDHFDSDMLQKIAKLNPSVRIIATIEVAEQFKIPQLEVGKTGEVYALGAFSVELFGEMHAVVSPDFPPPHNFGVLINNTVFDPGDSFTQCPKPYNTLAMAIMAPWLKLSDSIEYLKETPANVLVPMHSGFLNQKGEELYKTWFSPACEKLNKKYVALKPTESLEL